MATNWARERFLEVTNPRSTLHWVVVQVLQHDQILGAACVYWTALSHGGKAHDCIKGMYVQLIRYMNAVLCLATSIERTRDIVCDRHPE
jgi:hypothetical protein